MDITPWGSINRDCCKGSLETGHPYLWELLGGLGGGASLLRALKAMKGRLWGWASLFMGGSVGQPGVGSSTGDFEMWLKGALEVWSLSLWELCEGKLEGGLPCRGPKRYIEKALEMAISFHRGPVWGTCRRARLLGTLREG